MLNFCTSGVIILRAVFRIRDILVWIRDPGSGMGKKSRSGFGMNIPDHISESLESTFLG
jgi:hypothetical protein